MLFIVPLIGGILWMFLVKFVSWIADFGLTWGAAYAVGVIVTFIVYAINCILAANRRF